MYRANPHWAEVEERLYGSLLSSNESCLSPLQNAADAVEPVTRMGSEGAGDRRPGVMSS